MIEFWILPLKPRTLPKFVWKTGCSDFYVEIPVGRKHFRLNVFPWGQVSKVSLAPDVPSIRLYYTTTNELWMRKPKLDTDELAGTLVTYRARAFPFLRPRVEIDPAGPDMP